MVLFLFLCILLIIDLYGLVFVHMPTTQV